jgi:hypothetical protein
MSPSPTVVHLPNGQTLTVLPVFGGFFFKANDLNLHRNVFPAGWTVIIQSEDYSDEHELLNDTTSAELVGMPRERKKHIHPYQGYPTLRHDSLFISSISNPSSSDFKAPTSPSRQIAMMLWATLYWYFHQPAPSQYLTTADSKNTPEVARPRGEWRIHVKREGVLRGRNLIQKLERMGLIASEESFVGINPEENIPEGWSDMFISRRSFWQLSGKLFLFTLSPTGGSSFPTTPYDSRPNSPVRGGDRNQSPSKRESMEQGPSQLGSPGLWSATSFTGPFSSGSHLPTYYPPPPLQYTMTSGVRHPIRPKPPRQGETFYRRFVPSVGQYLSFRTASLSPKPVGFSGPTSPSSSAKQQQATGTKSSLPYHISTAAPSELSPQLPSIDADDILQMTDLQLLHKWMNIPRVSKFWGCEGHQSKQEKFLQNSLMSKNSFPAIGLWDNKPFGFFEIYWVKEDILGKYIGDRAEHYDRGVHVLVGEQEFRGEHRVKCWITSLAHWAFIEDYRTNSVLLEPRIDNERYARN